MNNAIKPCQAILFDKDGTLFDFGTTWEAWAGAFLLRLAEQDHDRAAHLGRQIGFDTTNQRFRPDSIAIAGTSGDVALALVPHFPTLSHSALIDILNQESQSAPQSEAVPLIPLLDQLRAMGLKLGVATNDGEMPALAHLQASGVVDRFDFIAGYDSGHGAKPGPGQLLAFATAMDLDPDCVVMVGDSTHDLIAGRAAGMRTVGVLTGLAETSELAPHADVVFPNIGHLPAWLTPA